jgi:ABC-type uncharacterized transport system permease subunit
MTNRYHILAFFILPITIIYPFILVHLTRSSNGSIRRQLTIVYRSSFGMKKYGTAIQMLRRLILVIIFTFTQIPETVQLMLYPFPFVCVVSCWYT